MAKPYLKLGEILVRQGLLTPEQLQQAIEEQKKRPGDLLGDILVRLGILTEKDLLRILSDQLDIPCADAASLIPARDQELEKVIPEDMARKYGVLPLTRAKNAVTVALRDPTDLVLLDNLRKMTGLNIQKVLASARDIAAAIDTFYGEGGLLKSAIAASYETQPDAAEIGLAAEERLSLDALAKTAEKTPVVQLTDLIIRQAIMERASDIHVEPFEEAASVRFRIDGVLHEIPPPSKNLFLPLISRLKILARMDIAEKRLPQDGTFHAMIEGRPIDFRVSTIPTIHGEKMVLRILDKSTVSFDLGSIGFEPKELELFRKAIHKPYGMILLTGPTGSGKTTTLYAGLSELNTKDKNIVTIEDPVEYKLSGINQVQAKPSIGLTFAGALRSFLRQDPDIILVGEIRDAETAHISVRAALTGHLVFSTLHTNDAPSSINRLIDIGVEPFFISSSLILVVAQRLVRKLCTHCRQAQKIPAYAPKRFAPKSGTIYRAVGCEACSQTGYFGRVALFEMMPVTETIQDLIAQRASVTSIRQTAEKAAMRTLEESGYEKVSAGVTSLEEVMRVTLPVD